MCLISVKIATLRPHLLKIIYWKRLSTFLVIVQGMQLGNVYIICNILHQHLPLVILVCWNDGLNLTHAQFHKFHCCACALTKGMPFWWVWCSVRTAALRGGKGSQPPQNFKVKMGGGGGRFNVNKIHNSFQFMSQNVYFLFVISQL